MWGLLIALALAPEVRAQAPDSTLNRRFQLAESFLAAGQYDRAVPLLEDLYRARPDAHVFYDRLKRAYENLKQFDKAIALVDSQIARNPLAVHVAEKARLLFLKGDTESAKATWKSAVDMPPLDPSTYRTVYLSLYQVRQFDAAIAVLEDGRAKLGDEAPFHADLAALHILNGDYERAVAEYVALLERDEKQLAYVRSRLAAITEEPQALSAAVAVTEQAVRDAPTVRPIRELMAWLYLEGGQYLQALNSFRALDQLGEKDGRALFSFAQQAGDAGAFEAASEAYAELLDRYPDAVIAPDALYGLAALHEQWAGHSVEVGASDAMDHLDRALATYREYLARFDAHAFAPNARYRIAHIQWEAFRDRAAARATLQELVQSAPSHPVADEARLDLGMIAVEEGRLSEARAAFARIVETIDRADLQGRARYQLALTHLYGGTVDTALAIASAVNRNTSMDVANDAIELRLLLQENQGPDSLNTALRSFGRALYLQRRGDVAAALVAVDSLLALQANHPVSDDARFLRAGLLRASGAFEAAWTAFAELPLMHPHSPLADRALFQAAEVLARELENGEAAIEYYTRLLTEYPGSVLAAEARSRIRALRGDGV